MAYEVLGLQAKPQPKLPLDIEQEKNDEDGT